MSRKRSSRAPKKGGKGAYAPRRGLRLEGLEDRRLLAGLALTFDGDADFANQDDVFVISRDGGDPSQLVVMRNGAPFLPIPLALVDQVQINGLGGNDTLIVDSSNGLISIPNGIRFDGGTGFDQLRLIEVGDLFHDSDQVFIGAQPGSGRSLIQNADPAASQRVDFQNIEPLIDAVPAVTFETTSFAGLASILPRDNVITLEPSQFLLGGFLFPTGARITVDDFEPIEFQNKTFANIHGGAGDDDFTVSTGFLPLGLQQLNVLGEDGDDRVRVNSMPIAKDGFTGALFVGGNGNDLLDASGPLSNYGATLIGGLGNDTLIGASGPAGSSFLVGQEGNDILVPGAASNVLDGGLGNDALLLSGTSADDAISFAQTAADKISYAINGENHTNETIGNLERVKIDPDDGDDSVLVRVANNLDVASLAVQVVGGAPNASDNLTVLDDGLGDVVIWRQAPDRRSGSVTVGALKPVTYDGMERVDVAPLNSVTGRTGDDLLGRLVIFNADPFEPNDSRPSAVNIERVAHSLTQPNIDPGGRVQVNPGGNPVNIPGDEDWYLLRPPTIGTYQAVVRYDRITTLINGQPGLPGDGDVFIQVRDSSGGLIQGGSAITGGQQVTFSADPTKTYYLRVYGKNEVAINTYSIDVTQIDTLGPQVTGLLIPGFPAFDLFHASALAGPTPLVTSLQVNLRDFITPDLLNRFNEADDAYVAIDQAIAQQLGNYRLVGDANGVIDIFRVTVNNATPAVGATATAMITLFFNKPLPDDRYTLTLFDSLRDPVGNALDGENDTVEPGNTNFASGNGTSGGAFQARFTIDSRPEIATYAGGPTSIDLNGNFGFDAQNVDATNRDSTYVFGANSDQRLAGKLGFPGTKFDVLAAYGNFNNQFRFLIDLNGNGTLDPGETFVPPLQINGLAVAANFDGNTANGDELALYDGKTWYVFNHLFGGGNLTLSTQFSNGLAGYPIAGDFDGDGKADVGTYTRDQFFFDLGNNGFGALDSTIGFGATGVLDRPVAADMDQDGATDVGLWIPFSGTQNGPGEWKFLLSAFRIPTPGTVDTLNHPFDPAPSGGDLAVSFGDSRALPLVGNFGPAVLQDAVPIPDEGELDAAPAALPAAANPSYAISAPSPGMLKLSWTGPTDAARYDIFRFNGQAYQKVASLAGTEGQYVDDGLQAGALYQYAVRTVAADETYVDHWLDARTTKPVGVAKLVAATADAATIDLTWQAPGAGVAGIEIYRYNGSSYALVAKLNSGAASYHDSGLQASTTYHYAIRVVYSGGAFVDSWIGGRTAKAMTAAAQAASAGYADLGWKAASGAIANQEIYRFDGQKYALIATIGASETSYRDQNLQAGKLYRYAVRVVRPDGSYTDRWLDAVATKSA